MTADDIKTGERLHGLIVGHFEPVGLDVALDPLQCVGDGGAGTRMHPPALGGILLHEVEAEAAAKNPLAPKPPGSMKSRCMSMMTSAVCATSKS